MLNSSIWPIDGTLTGTTTLGQGGTKSNGNDKIFHILKTPRLVLHYLMQLNVISRIRNGFKYSYQTQIIQFNIVCAQLNVFKYIKWFNTSILPTDGTLTGTTFRIRVGLGVISVKRYSIYPKTPVLKHHRPIVWCHTRTFVSGGGVSYPLQRCSQYILQPHPTGMAEMIKEFFLFLKVFVWKWT